METFRLAIQVDFYSQVHHVQVEASSKEQAIEKAALIAKSWEGGDREKISSDEVDKLLCVESTEVLDWDEDVEILKKSIK